MNPEIPDVPEILEDPVFELNVTLWMLQPLPGTAAIRPVLREAGYTLDSISRPLPFPLAQRAELAAIAGSSDPPAPDVLAAGSASADWLIIECKGSGFSPDSSNSRQAMKLLAIAANLTPPLALPAGQIRPGHVVYLTRDEDRDAMGETLAELRRRLAEKALPAGLSGVLGLSSHDDGVYIERSKTDTWPAGIADILGGPTRILKLEAGQDPRPLYFIPWDPSVDQRPKMRDHCRSILFARIASEAVAQVGRGEVPARVQLRIEQLLSRATYGVSDRWRSRPDVARTTRDCRRFLAKALQPVQEQLALALQADPERIEFTVSTEDDRDNVLDALLKANPLERHEAEN